MTSIGWATLDVIPSFDGFRRNVETGTERAMEAAGKSGGAKFGAAASKAMADEGATAGDKFGTEAAEAGGDAFSSKITDGVKAGALAAGAAAGVALGVGIFGALEKSALSDKLAAQLGVGEKKSAALGKVAGDLYSNAYGDSLEGVNGALRSVVTNLDGFRNVSKAKLKDVTASVLDLNAAFEEEPEAISRAAAQMVRTDLAKNSRQALNIITRGFQTGADKSQDLLDTFNEYGTQFRKLGLNGRKATGLLSQGLEGGARDADIVADSLKEFSLKTQEATTSTKTLAGGVTALDLTALGAAFEAVGVQVLDVDNNLSKAGETFQQDLAGGGDKARAALDKVLDGLRQIDDPLERNRTAVALFGTQAEDMGDALYSLDLDTAAKKLGKVGGAAEKMGATLSDNASTKIESFKRKMQTSLVDFIAEEFIPFFEDDVQPILEDFSAWFKRDGADALRDFGGDVKDITGKVETLVGFLNDLPKPAKVAGLLALVGGVGAAKIRGGSGGLAGTAGSALGLTKAVKVFETNPAALGGGGGDVDKGKGSSILATAAKAIIPVAAAAAATAGIKELSDKVAPDLTKKGIFGTPNFGTGLANADGGKGGILDMTGFAGVDDKDGEKVEKRLEGLISKAGVFGETLDLVGNKKVDPTLTIRGIEEGKRNLQKFIAQQVEARNPITPYVALTGYDRAMAQIATLRAEIHTIPTAGVDNGVPFVGGGAPRSGVTFTGPINVKSNDPREFANEVDKRTRDRAMGGR